MAFRLPAWMQPSPPRLATGPAARTADRMPADQALGHARLFDGQIVVLERVATERDGDLVGGEVVDARGAPREVMLEARVHRRLQIALADSRE